MSASVRQLTVAMILWFPLAFATAAMTEGRPKADSRLIDQQGNRVGARELSGHWLLVYFGYASCPDICPAALSKMTAVLNQLDVRDNLVTPLFVSVDPAHDTPARLREFASNFHPRLRALTGSKAALADAAQTFGVPWSASGDGIDHGVLMYLAAPDGRVVRTFHPEQGVTEILESVRTALKSGTWP